MLQTVHGDLPLQRITSGEARSMALESATGGDAVDLMIAMSDPVSNRSQVAGPVASCAGNSR